MKTYDLVEKFIINIKLDIESNLEMTKRTSIDATHHKGCFNCDDKMNQLELLSEPWTSVKYCNACDHINVVYHQDRMSGVHLDVVECYYSKN